MKCHCCDGVNLSQRAVCDDCGAKCGSSHEPVTVIPTADWLRLVELYEYVKPAHVFNKEYIEMDQLLAKVEVSK